ncbi:MAG: hypothetical protein ACLU1W_09045 [Collinsella sp.]
MAPQAYRHGERALSSERNPHDLVRHLHRPAALQRRRAGVALSSNVETGIASFGPRRIDAADPRMPVLRGVGEVAVIRNMGVWPAIPKTRASIEDAVAEHRQTRHATTSSTSKAPIAKFLMAAALGE